MGLMQRVNDIVAANLHEVVDRFENPEAMLRHAIREIEAEIAGLLARAADVLASEKLLSSQIALRTREAERWQQSAASAVAAGKDEDARAALAQKHECFDAVSVLRDDQDALRQAGAKLRKRLGRMRVKLAAARRFELVSRARVAAARRTLRCDPPGRGWARLETMQFEVDRAAARAEAYDALLADPLSDALDAERNLEQEASIDADLADLKRTQTPRN